MKKAFCALLFFLFHTGAYAQYDRSKVTDELDGILKSYAETSQVRILILMKDQVNMEQLENDLTARNVSIDERYRTVVTALKEKAGISQNSILAHLSYLNSADKNMVLEYAPLWITNAVWVIADVRTIKFLSYRTDIEFIEVDNKIEFEETPIFPAADNSAASETGLKVIKADKLWKLGYTGLGRIVMNIDSGVDETHPAINYKWRGLEVPWYHAWLDADGSNNPTWCSDHGTHTMGTMTGRSPSGDTIGVAPDSKWIAAKRGCSGNYEFFAITAMQWAMNPDSNIATNDYPDAICCSWQIFNLANECTGTYVTAFNSMEAAGIAMVFAAGNSGSGAMTISSPSNINTNLVNNFCVGAVDGSSPTFAIASFSSRGPSKCAGTGSLLIKPEVSAPGVNVRSSVLNGNYGLSSGTSMATPHVAGSVAILRQFAPNLKGSQILLGLYMSAIDLGTAGEDNTYGMGLIDVYAAMIKLGPQIVHTKLNDTLNTAGPYRVRATITPSTITNAKIDTSSIKLFWGRGGSITDSVKMQKDTGNVWVANIPGNGTPTAYKYFIRVKDTLNVREHSPSDVPVNVHSFNAGVVSISGNGTIEPIEFSLMQNYPNPFNPETNIQYSIAERNFVKIEVMDILGREVAVLVSEFKNAGRYNVDLDGRNLSSGVYYYRITAGSFVQTKKMLLVK